MKTTFILCAIFFLSVNLTADNKSLDTLISRRHRVLQQIEKERIKWLEEEAIYLARLQIIEKENSLVEKEIVQTRQKLSNLSTQEKELIRRQQQEEAFIKKMNSSFKEAFDRMNNTIQAMPAELIVAVPHYQQWQKLKLDNETSLDKRLKTFLAFSKDIRGLQQKVNFSSRIISIGGSEQEVDVIYLGTVVGYYLSRDRKSAGMIKRNNNKWQTLPDNGLLEPLAKLKSELKAGTLLELVELPFPGKEK